MNPTKPHLTRATVYFGLSLALMVLFALTCPFPLSRDQLTKSISILMAVWILQVLAAILLLRKRRASFIHGMARASLMGMLIFIPYILSAWLEISNDSVFFFGSMMLAILIMVFRYHAEVIRLHLSMSWWYLWLISLIVVIGLQMTVVFHLL